MIENFVSVDIYIRFFIAISLVMLLIGLSAWLASFLGFNIPLKLKGLTKLTSYKDRRLVIVETIPLDAKRQLILISRDNVEHLLCIGGSTDFIVEANIKTSLLSHGINQQVINQINHPRSIPKVS